MNALIKPTNINKLEVFHNKREKRWELKLGLEYSDNSTDETTEFFKDPMTLSHWITAVVTATLGGNVDLERLRGYRRNETDWAGMDGMDNPLIVNKAGRAQLLLEKGTDDLVWMVDQFRAVWDETYRIWRVVCLFGSWTTPDVAGYTQVKTAENGWKEVNVPYLRYSVPHIPVGTTAMLQEFLNKHAGLLGQKTTTAAIRDFQLAEKDVREREFWAAWESGPTEKFPFVESHKDKTPDGGIPANWLTFSYRHKTDTWVTPIIYGCWEKSDERHEYLDGTYDDWHVNHDTRYHLTKEDHADFQSMLDEVFNNMMQYNPEKEVCNGWEVFIRPDTDE